MKESGDERRESREGRRESREGRRKEGGDKEWEAKDLRTPVFMASGLMTVNHSRSTSLGF